MSTSPWRGARGSRIRGWHVLLLLLSLLVIGTVLFELTHASERRASGSTRVRNSLLDILTPIDMTDGLARPSAIVHLRDARIEVLTPTLTQPRAGIRARRRDHSRTSDSIGLLGHGTTTSRVVVDGAEGHYPGEPTHFSYTIEMIDVTKPSTVALNGSQLNMKPSGDPGWYYESASDTLVVTTAALPTSRELTVETTGVREIVRSEPSGAAQ
jgi:hypothetical protein